MKKEQIQKQIDKLHVKNGQIVGAVNGGSISVEDAKLMLQANAERIDYLKNKLS